MKHLEPRVRFSVVPYVSQSEIVPGKDGLEEPIIHVEVGIEPSEGKTDVVNVNVINGTVHVTFILF
jgi:hypothetical protein